MRARVLSSLPIGNCTALMPCGPQAMAQRPIAVSNMVKLWSVMAGSVVWLQVVSLMLACKIGLEIVASHPNPGRESGAVPRKSQRGRPGGAPPVRSGYLFRERNDIVGQGLGLLQHREVAAVLML